jgi:hypothetical protein
MQDENFATVAVASNAMLHAKSDLRMKTNNA